MAAKAVTQNRRETQVPARREWRREGRARGSNVHNVHGDGRKKSQRPHPQRTGVRTPACARAIADHNDANEPPARWHGLV